MSRYRLVKSRRRRTNFRTGNHRRTRFETLEARQLLAADIAVSWIASEESDNGLFVEHPEVLEILHPAATIADNVDALSPVEASAADTFRLHSLPGADHTIYLDFDGHTTEGTTWNAASGRSSIVSPAYDPSGNGPAFTSSELDRIQRIWRRVAEDFSPFHVNVTTEDPGEQALRRSGGDDAQWGTRVVITKDWDSCGCGGFAYMNSFNDSADEPVFVFNTSEIGVSAASSHEIGHALGLGHDGLSGGSPYYNGHGSGETGWGPIMGSGYYKNMTTWDTGQYHNSSNSQDDFDVITSRNGFGYRTDDHGDEIGSATPLETLGANAANSALIDVAAFGVIERADDLDVFEFQTGAGTINLTFDSYVQEVFINDGSSFTRLIESTPVGSQGTNLDISATLYDSSGTPVATSNPTNGLSASFLNLELPAGTYYAAVDGSGVGNFAANPPSGYSDVVSRGQYAVSGTIVAIDGNRAPVANDDFAAVDQDAWIQLDVLANDSDPDGDGLAIHSLSQGTHGSVVDNGDGTLTYTPDPGFSGSDAFSYVITDGDLTSTATVDITVSPLTSDTIGFSGIAADVDHQWQTVTLPVSFTNPVVVAGGATANGWNQGVVRIKNVTANSFQIRFQEWDYHDGTHTTEDIGFLVVEAGAHTLNDGTQLVAGTTASLPNETLKPIAFETTFDSMPLVLAQTMSYNDTAAAADRIGNVSASGFELTLYEEEAADGIHSTETVGFIAIDRGTAQHGEIGLNAVVTGDTVTHADTTVNFGSIGGSSQPIILSDAQTLDGGDVGSIRHRSSTANSVTLWFEEEASRDSELSHTTEVAGVLAIQPGLIGVANPPQPPQPSAEIGFSGTALGVDHQWKTVPLPQSFDNPVVVAGGATVNGWNQGVVRVRNVTSNSFQIRFQEWDYLDGTHATEDIGYLVVEAGTHRLSDGTQVVAGTTTSLANENSKNVAFAAAFGGTPLVLAQTMTINDTAAVTDRISNVSADGFSVALYEEEAADGIHSPETVGYIAIDRGASQSGDVSLNAVVTGDTVTHTDTTVTFGSLGGSTSPVILADSQTLDGADTGSIRHRSSTASSVTVWFEEEASRDSEQNHTTEVAGVLALEPGILVADVEPASSPWLDSQLVQATIENSPSDESVPLIEHGDDFGSQNNAEWLLPLQQLVEIVAAGRQRMREFSSAWPNDSESRGKPKFSVPSELTAVQETTDRLFRDIELLDHLADRIHGMAGL
ncbi:Ig-like domain-containing protein [Roseimaritima ulvae]|uniref:Ig-like domain-containing protein n=1 Tax=Roseimaritima ulvae TaxID=980254 RepID=UPI000830CBFC|nr:Ig-like domain-containing protein [Roseimaritima ulvae]